MPIFAMINCECKVATAGLHFCVGNLSDLVWLTSSHCHFKIDSVGPMSVAGGTAIVAANLQGADL